METLSMKWMKMILTAVAVVGFASVASADETSRVAVQVPDAASTLALLGLAVSSLGLMARKLR
jgi:hypothetical protein